MQKNSYFRNVLRRQNMAKMLVFNFFLGLASYPRLLIEVFTRKNFGQRYFSFATVLTVLAILSAIPAISNGLISLFGRHSYHQASFWSKYATWYLFTGAFALFAFFRSREIKRNPSVFDFGKFSLYAGDINPNFYKIQLFGKKAGIREIETLYEPATFFILGLILNYLGQNVGMLLMVSSVAYSISYMAAYQSGDNFVMDHIDEVIMNEELENAFVNDLPGEKTRGVRFHMDKPASKNMRSKLSETFIENDEPTFAL